MLTQICPQYHFFMRVWISGQDRKMVTVANLVGIQDERGIDGFQETLARI